MLGHRSDRSCIRFSVPRNHITSATRQQRCAFADDEVYPTCSVLDLPIEFIVCMDSGTAARDYEKTDRRVCLHDNPFVEESERDNST